MRTLQPCVDRSLCELVGLSLPMLGDVQESEFEVQSFLLHNLRQIGFAVRGEVNVRGHVNEIGERKGYRKSDRYQCRFDLVIYENETASHIVEVKAKPVKKHRADLVDHRQARRYSSFGVPVTFVYGMGDARDFIGKVHREGLDAFRSDDAGD